MFTRRRVVIALGATALSAPLASFAQQQPKVRRIGFLGGRSRSTAYVDYDAFMQGMGNLGYVEGKNLVIEWRYADGKYERLPAMAAELVRMKVEAIVTEGTPAAQAAQRATRTIPIITAVVGDPVGSGLAASLSHPGGNITGLASLSVELYAKRLDLLHQILPGMRRVGFLYNPDTPADRLGLKQFESACGKLNVKSLRAPARNGDEIASAFQTLSREKAQGLIVTSSSMVGLRGKIIEHAAKNRLPAIYTRSVFAESGGLIAYGPDYPDLNRRAAAYVDKIFKGAKPADLPIEQPTQFELVINGKAAKALGLAIPQELLLRADKVIE